MANAEILKVGIDNNKPLCILGNCNSGKTNLLYYLATLCSHKDKYVLGYPGELPGVTNLSSLQDLSLVQDCVVMIDEIDEFIPIYEKKANDSLKRVLKFAEHNRIKLLFDTQLSQFVNRMMEALVPQWGICQIDIFSLKQGSKSKRILLDYIKKPEWINSELGMRLPVGKFVWFNDGCAAGENGIYDFPDMKIGKAWGHGGRVPPELASFNTSDVGTPPQTPPQSAQKSAKNSARQNV